MNDFPIQSGPVQTGRIKVPWSVAEQAYLGYIKKYGGGQSLETIARRGGFGIAEMDEFHPEWREHIKLRKENTRLREFLKRCNEIMPACPVCKGNLKTWENLAENKTIRVGHATDCELAEELADAVGGDD